MRPDLEDYEDLTPEDAPRSRAMSWLVLVVAVGGFAALAYYAYHSGTSATHEGDMLIVQADETPIKQVPADPEGEQFANKDKTIYDVIAPANQGAGSVEKLLPEPEKPVLDARNVAEPVVEEQAPNPVTSTAPATGATTYVSKEVAKPATAVDPVDVQSLKQPTPATMPEPVAGLTSPQPSVVVPKPVAVAPAVQAEAAGAPKFVNESSVGGKKTAAAETKKAEVKKAPTVKKETTEAAKKPAAGGAYQIQLGAYKTEDEARSSWKKMAAKFSAVLSGSPSVIKADLPNGTFYRLRTGGFASADAAKAACAKLTAQKQACIPVGK